jgi:FkbM family methyltransferase
VLDIGANVGAFSVWAAAKWPNCTIDAYEPNPVAFQLLLENAADLGDRIRCHSFGVRDRSGTGMLVPGPNNLGEASFHSEGEGPEVEFIAASLLQSADFIKVDTEGSELEILGDLALGKHLQVLRGVAYEWHCIQHRWALGALMTGNGFKLMDETLVLHPSIELGAQGVAKWLKASEVSG